MSLSTDQKLSLRALVALVMGSMIGSGIFALPSALAQQTGSLGAIIAWCIAGFGMLTLALAFQNLSRRRPDLDTGIYAYAQEGFGDYLGFSSALGYWIGCCIADVACIILIKATLGVFFPIFGDGTTPMALLAGTGLIWGVHFLILRGIKEAAILNTIATIAKIVPICVFIVVILFHFDSKIFMENLWGGVGYTPSSLLGQVRNTMLVTVFVFVGIEGASVYSRYAKRREDVGIATVLGFLGVLGLLVLVTVPAYGVMLRAEMAGLPTPSMAGVFQVIVGHWGAVFIATGLVVSILGNYLSWSLLAAEVMFSAAKANAMPAFLAKENKNNAPITALLVSNIIIQLFLLLTPFADSAFKLALKMTSAMTLIPYLLVGGFAFKLAFTGETYETAPGPRRGDMVKGFLATLYAFGMLAAGGLRFIMLSAILYFIGTILYIMVRREQKKTLFTPAELVVFLAVGAMACFGVWSLASGNLVF